nr:MAG TPA: hypothetical protein [Caudoviricetes sp.]
MLSSLGPQNNSCSDVLFLLSDFYLIRSVRSFSYNPDRRRFLL